MESRYVYGEDDRLIDWAEAIVPNGRFRNDARAIGLERNDVLRAVVVFDTFSQGDCLVHVASDGSGRWFDRGFAVHAMAYPFIQLGNRRISAVISTLNERSLRFTRHFGGWKEEGRLREAGEDGEDMIVFGMLRRECPFLPLVHGGAGIKLGRAL